MCAVQTRGRGDCRVNEGSELTVNLVEYMVQAVCNMMQRDECWQVVENLKTIIRKVGQYVDPSDVCVNVGFCSGMYRPFIPSDTSYPTVDA